MRLLDRAPTADEARAVTGWAYPAPFDRYDLGPDDAGLLLARSPGGEGCYPAVGEGPDGRGELLAFVVFGAEARVRGQEPRPGVLDVGAGVRPDLVSRGLGTDLLRQALVLARRRWQPVAFRTVVAAFNDRSLALCRRAGFEPVRDFAGPGGTPFLELELRRLGSSGRAAQRSDG